MANVIYDIGPDWMINPFIGAGVGVNHLEMTVDGQFSNVTGVVTTQAGANPPIQNLHIDGGATVFAWQLIGGASWKATDRLKVDATYRFLSGSDGRWNSVGTAALQPGQFQGKYRDQSVTLGLRYYLQHDTYDNSGYKSDADFKPISTTYTLTGLKQKSDGLTPKIGIDV